jgi:hypothetical protein
MISSTIRRLTTVEASKGLRNNTIPIIVTSMLMLVLWAVGNHDLYLLPLFTYERTNRGELIFCKKCFVRLIYVENPVFLHIVRKPFSTSIYQHLPIGG